MRSTHITDAEHPLRVAARQLVADWPPLTPDQRAYLESLLRNNQQIMRRRAA